MLKYTVSLIALFLTACSSPVEIPDTTVGNMSNREVCQRIVANRGAIQSMANEMVKSYREAAIKGYNANIENGLLELSKRGFKQNELFYIRSGQLDSALPKRTRECITVQPL